LAVWLFGSVEEVLLFLKGFSYKTGFLENDFTNLKNKGMTLQTIVVKLKKANTFKKVVRRRL